MALIIGTDGPNFINSVTIPQTTAFDDFVFAEGGDDTVDGWLGNDLVFGGSGNDSLQGDIGNDTLNGESDNDILKGESNNDSLDGGSGDDTLIGSFGHDTLNGGFGNDILIGGQGEDDFLIESPLHGFDTITDFDRDEFDKVVINTSGSDFTESSLTYMYHSLTQTTTVIFNPVDAAPMRIFEVTNLSSISDFLPSDVEFI